MLSQHTVKSDAMVRVVVLLSLHMCMLFTATMQTSGDGYQSSCGFVDGEYVCVASDTETLLIPCGRFTQQIGLAYTYYLLGSTRPLAEGTMDYLAINVSRSDNGLHVCCKPNVSSNMSDYPCYRLNITYAPVQVAMEWPSGYNKWPIIGEPFSLACPLEGNPNAAYHWRKSPSLDGSEESSDINDDDVIFSQDGRSWHVDAYSEHDNGLYECYATNAFGTASFSDVHTFFLTTEKCIGSHVQGDPAIDVSPQNVSYYAEGTTVKLKCTALFADYLSQKPSWYKVNDSILAYCDGPNFKQTAQYDDNKCKWSNDLTIYNFTEDLVGEYTCGFYQHNKSLFLELPEVYTYFQENDQKTLSAVAPAIALVLTCFLLVCLVAVIFKIVRKLKLTSYKRSKEPPFSGFRYDVFISVHDEAREFVQEHILLPLEHQCSPPYKVCWHLRDFIAGIPITEQIADAVLHSRKIIFVFSPHFMESTFCQMELRHSLHRLSTTHTRCIVPISMSDQCVPKNIKSILTYWPIIPADEDQMVEKICHFLGFPMEEILIDREDEILLQ